MSPRSMRNVCTVPVHLPRRHQKWVLPARPVNRPSTDRDIAGMTTLDLTRRSLRRTDRPAAPGPCLTSRPGADAVIVAMFVLTLLLFAAGLLGLSG
jgi:hypothetical protein